jgi:signal transduction histidine kinase
MADNTRLKQVLINLLSNAVHYTEEGGSITLVSEDVPDDRVRISVTDTGPGIGEDQQAGLFEPNRPGNGEGSVAGTGIGLSIVKQRVEAMGGVVGFETEVGKGSSFWIEFPAIEKTGAKPAEKIEVPETDDHLEQPSIVATVLYIEEIGRAHV